MKKVLSALVGICLAAATFAQGDDCSQATNLGTLPTPAGCPTGGAGTTLTYNGTTVGATAENPYSSLTCMDAPAADVWVSFVASGNELDINFSSGLGDANIGIYTGDCNNLVGVFCEASNNGNISTLLTPLVPGETYYMQISGQNETDFSNFTLELTSINNCSLCLLGAGLTANPAPANGFYLPGQTVEFCMEITEFEQIGANWLAGVVPDLGPMWDAGTLTGVSAPNAQGSYVWVWDNGPFGEGWYVDVDPAGPAGPDGNYTNNYGDPGIDGTGSWTFCFEVTASSSCTAGGDLGLTIDTYSDYETGGWGSNGCVGDPVIPFTAFMMCCDVPIFSSTPETCSGISDGTITVEGQNGTAPYDYVYENSAGTTVFTDNNVVGPSTATGLAPDTYSVTVTDDNGCVQVVDVVVNPAPLFAVTASATPSLCAGVPCTGTVSSSPTGGTGGISYTWDGGLGAGQNHTGVCAGTFTVSATDANGCVVTDAATVTAPPLLTVTAGGTQESCDGLCDGTLTSTASGGTGAISYTWNGGVGAGQNPTGICDGTYTVTATDANGCTATDSYTVAPGVIITAVIDPIASQCLTGNSFSFDGSNSTISAGTITSYNWDFGDGSGSGSGSTPSYTYGSSGTYTVTLTVSDGTCTDQVTQNVTVFAEPTVTASGTNVICNGANNGTVSASATGTSGYTYAWDIPASGANQSGLGAGTYTVTVTDVNGCTDVDSYTVVEPPLLVVTATGTNVSCNGLCDGTLDGTISGGTTPYTISWDGGPSSGTEDQTNVCAGVYTLTVTDANGCIQTATYTVTEPPLLTATSTSTNMTCNGVCDGTLDATVGGGTPGYTYSWDGGPSTGTEDQTGVCAGTYTLTVTDAGGCIATTSSTITEPPLLTVTVTGTNVSCNGVCDGTVSSSVTGGTGAITYSWDNGAGSSATASGLCANTYTLTVTDANGCTATDSYTVTQPPVLTVTIAGTDATCNGVCDGTATTTVTGGTAPYTYQWDDPGLSTTANLSGLCANTFNVTVTDASGCSATDAVVITEPTPIVVTTGSNDATCGASDGDVSSSASGGAGGYTYSWSDATPTVVGTTANVGSLPSGTYTVTVTDAAGCTETAVAIINTTTGGTANAVVDNQVTCNGLCDGQATASMTGGTAPFTYLWSDGQTTATATGLCPGAYSVDVTDVNGCQSSAAINITEPPLLVVAITGQADPLCASSCDGTADATATGGTAPLTYSWTTGGTTLSETGMCSGTHTITVTDANGCIATADVTLTDPPVLTTAISMTPATCNGTCDGALDLTVTGGTGTMTYAWDNAATSEDIASVCAGTYNVTVTDANGCVSNDGATVTEPTAIVLTPSGNDEICSQSNGDVSVVATGGTVAVDYTYSWTDGGGASVGTTAGVTGLAAGTYTVVVTDDNGCTETVNVTINNQPAGTIVVTLDNNASCSGVCDGGATATMTGGTGAFTYLWDNGETTQSAIGLCVGAHTVDVTDANGCQVSGNINITEPAPMTLTLAGTDPLCNGSTDGSADATIAGGTAPYTISWQHGPTSEDLTGVLGAGTYTLDVTDANGCTVSASVTLTDPAAITSSITGNDISCNGSADGDATVTASGGTGTLVYNWSPAPGAGQGTTSATGLGPVTYTVTITDDNGCFVSETFTPTEPAALVLTPSSTQSNCGQADGSVSVTVTGGTAAVDYTYSWEDATPTVVGTSATVTNLAAGVYTITITDDNGCTETATATITDASGATLSNTFVDVSCNGGNNGLIDLTVTGGTAPITYSWTGPGGFTDNIEDISNLQAGVYDVTVTDAVGCVATASITISEPAALVLTPASVDALCFGSADGEVSASTTGGTPAYTYEWYDNAALTNNVGSGSPVNGLAAGTYYVEVTDGNGCTTSAQVDINEPADMVVTTSVTDANCGQADGVISVTGTTGGSGVYVSEDWVDATPAPVVDPNAVPAGTYTVTVTDDNGCTGTAVANVADLAGPTTNLLGVVPVSCNGGCDGSAAVEGSGGTGPYTYVWAPTPGAGQGTATITDLCAGIYSVTVTDANGCQDNFSVTITEPTPVDVTITASTDVSGFGLSDGDATAAGSGGTPVYTYEWFTGCPPGATTGQTGTSATGLAAGDYSVIITDSKGCMDTTCVTINEPGAISSSLSTVDVTCFGGCDGSATVSASGGMPGYTYVWYDGVSTPIGQTGVTATGLCAGDYYVEVTDQNSITHTSVTVTITEPTQITGTTGVISNYNGQDISCAGVCDGSAQVTPSGGTPPYTYLWSDGQTTDIAIGLCSGNYTVDVTDANGCVASFSVTITEPLPLTNVITSNDASCYGVCDGDATATPSNGTAPYTYQWNDPGLSTSATASVLCVGSYDVVVTDANGCTVNGTAVINEPTQIVLDSDSTESNCGSADGSVTVLIVSGDGPLTQQWDAAAGNATTATVTGLSAGCYDVDVSDVHGCVQNRTVCVTDAGAPQVEILTLTDASCKDTCDGFAQVQVTPGTNSVPPLSFEWYDNTMTPIGQSTASAVGLCAGDYIAEMTDANGCQATVAVTIGEPTQLVASITSTSDVTCFGDCDGQATVTAGGGTVGYSYSWNDPTNQTTATATGLCPTNFTVTVTDGNGCVTTIPATINEPLQILATASSVAAFCNTGSGTATATVTQGGVGALSYLWAPSGQTTNPATGLTPGTYNVTITDADGCQGTASTTVGNIPASVATAQVVNNVSCNGLCDGEASVSMGGTGTAPYSYEWFNAVTGASTGQTTQNATGLCAGDYYCVATDANTCQSVSDTITITEPAVLAVTTTTTDANCKSDCSGTATATTTGGTGAITYSWDDPLLQTSQTATGLCANTFNVVVTDANGCTATTAATVNEPNQIVLDSTVVDANCGLADGSGCVIATGGVGGFTYAWPSGTTTSCDAGLSASSYLVTVTDANNCTEDIVVTVSDLLGPTAAITATTNVSCNGLSDGSATVDMTGGAGVSFTVQWDANASNQTTPTASNLAAGIYTVTITDDLGCSASTSATITEPDLITTNPGFIDPSCFGYCDGVMGIVVAGGTPPYSYTWRDAANNPIGGNQDTISGMCSGSYTLEVVDANGCTEILNYTLTDPAQVSASVSSTDVFCNGACDGTGSATGVVGVGTFTYLWDAAAGSQTTATATGLCPGTYTCVITDADGCFTDVSAIVTEPPALTSSITNFGHNSCNGSCDGFAEVDPVGGTAPYTYDWGTAGTTQQITALCAGTYTVMVTDANGCQSSSTVIITEPAALGVTSTSTDNSCFESCDGTASVSVSGGTGPYNYQWDDPTFATTTNVSNLCAGTWTCDITDANGCTISESVIIGQPSLLGIVINSVTDANCGQPNGEICITTVGGVGPFTYQWNDPSFTTTACLTGVAANCYQITVLDANGCSTDSTICINDIAGPTVALNGVTDVSCFGAGDGTIDFTVTGGFGTLTYEFYESPSTLITTGTGPYTGLDGGTYFLQVTDAAGCLGQDVGTIAEPNALNSAITSSLDVTCAGACDGQAIVSIAGGSTPYTINWTNGQTTNQADNLCAGSWTANILDANLCPSSATVVITEPLPLAITSTSSDVTCNGGNDGQINLTVTGGTPAYNYLWAPPASSGSLGSALTAGAYNIDVTDANGCVESTIVTVNEPPVLNVTYASVNSTCTQCNGSASLTVTGGTGPFIYQWLNGGSNPSAPTNTGLCPGNHDVIVTDANGCQFSLTVVVNDEPAPQIDAMSFTAPLCNGGNNGTATVVASGGTGVLSYLWDAAAGLQTSDVASGLAVGTYCVAVSDVNNCVVSNCVTVSEPSALNPVPDGTTTICYGDSTQVWASGSGGTPGYTINWTAPGFAGPGPIMVNPLVTTDYCFTVTDANGCVSPSACVTIDVLPQLDIDMMPATAICDGDQVDVVASVTGGNGGPYTFSWTDDGGNSHTPTGAGSPSTIQDSPVTDTWYYVTVSDGCSLDEVDSVQVTINALPTAFLNVVDSNGCAAFTANFILNTDIGVNFDYDFDCDGLVDLTTTSTTPSNTYSVAGLYDVCVTVTSADGCVSNITTPGIVEVYPVPTAAFDADPWNATEVNPLIDFIDQSTGANTYVWYFGDGDSIAGLGSDLVGSANTTGTVADPSHFYNSTGDYTVTQIVTNEFGCTDQVSHVVSIDPEQTIYVPNSFTPNGDGKNDYFIPQGVGLDNEHFTMYIFNRWGELIFETHSLNQPWDGTAKGRDGISQEDVYVWLVKTKDIEGHDKEYKGHVTLLK